MSPFVIALALNLFFGGPAEKVEYSLFEDHAWYLLDDSFLREYEEIDNSGFALPSPWPDIERVHESSVPYTCKPGVQEPMIEEACI